MAVTIGNARISEFGTVNGKKGDQTGKEVMTQSFGSGGTWERIYRPKSTSVARKIATAMSQACKNNNIGYSQSDRLSLDKEAKKHDYNLSNVGKCNCDCSSLDAVCINAAGVKINPGMYSGSAPTLISNTGKFTCITDAKLCKKGKGLRAGDILWRKGHMGVVVEGDIPLTTPNSGKKKTVVQIAKEIVAGKCSDPRWKSWGVGATRKARLKKAGYDYKEVQKAVNKLMK